ncbi:MAG: acetoacetate--CoA ligase [Dehalococcoidia bacterium]|nr:acetoacetate--CoA ligase [Dehalococcoidia bacterium]|tara:strand:- start:10612 stop:12609 length:1998 start_codon:yes stop_codon:yes gene_type:complete
MQEKNQNTVKEGSVLWQPSPERKATSNIANYIEWLSRTRNLNFEGYIDLWNWSVDDIDAFWESLWSYFKITYSHTYSHVIDNSKMPNTNWFQGAKLNYAEQSLKLNTDNTAIISKSEIRNISKISHRELTQRVGSFSDGLRKLGVKKGDRVCAVMPNIPEAIIGFLATASIGAIWSACSPEFGINSIIDRFQQIEPKILITVDGYRFGGKDFDKTSDIKDLSNTIKSLDTTIVLPYLSTKPNLDINKYIIWDEVESETHDPIFEQVPFSHPLWILYSSGTTGLPKPIVHSHGGIIIEHMKVLSLHLDLKQADNFFWFTTTGWMMWNLLIGGLLIGSTLVLYDGDPAYPNLDTLWKFAEDTGTTYFGTSAPFIQSCMKANLNPSKHFNTSLIKGLGSTGSPLSPEGFKWVYDNVNETLLLGSFSGGTDLCTGFVGPIPLLPITAGEIQCRCLGAKVEAYDPSGKSLLNEVGELVIEKPMPSMPTNFWNDLGNKRYHQSYFDLYPQTWRHGDWIKITDRGTCIIYGRSDSTLNRGGIRMGTSEFYRIIDSIKEIDDSLIIDLPTNNEESQLILFIAVASKLGMTSDLDDKIKTQIRSNLSPRHVPNQIIRVESIPKTLNGKKLEIPVKKILSGTPVHEALNIESVSNPDSLKLFVNFSKKQANRTED